LPGSSYADVRLPKIFGSNMVLQRDRELKVWGWADANEKVTVSFNGRN
jgi:sialate O-acetylesterase